ncbi:MAG: hypothetical protein NUV67_06175, partial [archaeon]|nr:hypothetical protein [archaeon]
MSKFGFVLLLFFALFFSSFSFSAVTYTQCDEDGGCLELCSDDGSGEYYGVNIWKKRPNVGGPATITQEKSNYLPGANWDQLGTSGLKNLQPGDEIGVMFCLKNNSAIPFQRIVADHSLSKTLTFDSGTVPWSYNPGPGNEWFGYGVFVRNYDYNYSGFDYVEAGFPWQLGEGGAQKISATINPGDHKYFFVKTVIPADIANYASYNFGLAVRNQQGSELFAPAPGIQNVNITNAAGLAFDPHVTITQAPTNPMLGVSDGSEDLVFSVTNTGTFFDGVISDPSDPDYDSSVFRISSSPHVGSFCKYGGGTTLPGIYDSAASTITCPIGVDYLYGRGQLICNTVKGPFEHSQMLTVTRVYLSTDNSGNIIGVCANRLNTDFLFGLSQITVDISLNYDDPNAQALAGETLKFKAYIDDPNRQGPSVQLQSDSVAIGPSFSLGQCTQIMGACAGTNNTHTLTVEDIENLLGGSVHFITIETYLGDSSNPQNLLDVSTTTFQVPRVLQPDGEVYFPLIDPYTAGDIFALGIRNLASVPMKFKVSLIEGDASTISIVNPDGTPMEPPPNYFATDYVTQNFIPAASAGIPEVGEVIYMRLGSNS